MNPTRTILLAVLGLVAAACVGGWLGWVLGEEGRA